MSREAVGRVSDGGRPVPFERRARACHEQAHQAVVRVASAVVHAGALEVINSAVVTCVRVIFRSNIAGDWGGAILVSSAATFTVIDSWCARFSPHRRASTCLMALSTCATHHLGLSRTKQARPITSQAARSASPAARRC